MEIIGWIVSVVGIVLVGAGGLVALLWSADKVITAIRAKGADEQRLRDRNRLHQDAWWFSEDKPTMDLLMDLAHGTDVSSARDKWQKARMGNGVVD
jgi:hypothetical protein